MSADRAPHIPQMQVICKNNQTTNASVHGSENGYCITPSFYIEVAYRLRRSASQPLACVTELHNTETWWWWWWGGRQGVYQSSQVAFIQNKMTHSSNTHTHTQSPFYPMYVSADAFINRICYSVKWSLWMLCLEDVLGCTSQLGCDLRLPLEICLVTLWLCTLASSSPDTAMHYMAVLPKHMLITGLCKSFEPSLI